MVTKGNRTNKEIIKIYKKTFGLHIPVNKQAESWDEARLVEHLTYWVKRGLEHNNKHSTALLESLTQMSTLEKYAYLGSAISRISY
ncbi:MAG: hypothetical protein AAGE84_21980 [Cyanobacteria bacterium P01_G01_bin.39]